METTTPATFWDLVFGALALNPEVFQQITQMPGSGRLALLTVLAAGVAQLLGQSVVLFINRVKPIRFMLSVLVGAGLFALIYGFWALTIGLISSFFKLNMPLDVIFRVLGLSYAPQMLGFLVALPYIGIPILSLLSIWSLLALVVGFGAVAIVNQWVALACVGLGWLVLQLFQRTIGRPIITLGRMILNWVAGTKLARTQTETEALLLEGWHSRLNSTMTAPARSTSVQLDGMGTPVPPQLPRAWRKYVGLGLILLTATGVIAIASHQDIALWYATLKVGTRLVFRLSVITMLAFVASILLTPFEALGWWAGWYGDEPLAYYGDLLEAEEQDADAARYVFFLDGINQGTYSYLPEVDRFLDQLAQALPNDIRIVRGIMPYSVINRPLTQRRPMAFLWRKIDHAVAKDPNSLIGQFINVRNVVAVAVSADGRYGSVQNQGLAQVLLNSLLHYGYDLEQKTPITLIGYSGGGQMSIGAVPYLQLATGAPIEVISLGGVMSGAMRGILTVERLFHLRGDKDAVEKLGRIMFPSRWPIVDSSPWNRAMQQGKIQLISLGPVGHNGKDGPLWEASFLPDGRSHLQQTLDVFTKILLAQES